MSTAPILCLIRLQKYHFQELFSLMQIADTDFLYSLYKSLWIKLKQHMLVECFHSSLSRSDKYSVLSQLIFQKKLSDNRTRFFFGMHTQYSLNIFNIYTFTKQIPLIYSFQKPTAACYKCNACQNFIPYVHLFPPIFSKQRASLI